jgi:hypothetical protein
MNFKHLISTLLIAVTFTAQAADRVIQAPSAGGNVVFKNSSGSTTATIDSTGALTTAGSVKSDSITNSAGTGSPSFPYGISDDSLYREKNYVVNANGGANPSPNTTCASYTGGVCINGTFPVAKVTSAGLLNAGTAFSFGATTTGSYAQWGVNTFETVLKNKLCEVSFSYQGLAADATAQVIINNVIVANTSIVADTVSPRTGGMTFACGDLTNLPVLRITAGATSLNGGRVTKIYMGEARSVSSGAIITNSTNFTPILRGETTNPTYTAGGVSSWRRVGGSLELTVFMSLSSVSGGSGGVVFNINDAVPGIQIDSSKVKINSVGAPGVTGAWYDNSAIKTFNIDVLPSGTNLLTLYKKNGLNDTSNSVGLLVTELAGADQIGFTISLPIIGWTATDVVTPAAATATYVGTYRTSSGQTISSGIATEVLFNAERADSKDEYSTSTGRWTAKSSGWYTFSFSLRVLPGATVPTYTEAYLRVNSADPYIGTQLATDMTANKERMLSGSATIYVQAGQYISLWIQAVGQPVTIAHSGATNDVSSFYVTSAQQAGTQSFYMQGPMRGTNTGNAVPAGYVGTYRKTVASSAVALVPSGYVTLVEDTLPIGLWKCDVAPAVIVTANGASIFLNVSVDGALQNEYSAFSASAIGRARQVFPLVVSSNGTNKIQARVQASGTVTGTGLDFGSEESYILCTQLD